MITMFQDVEVEDRDCYMCQINTAVMKKQIGCIDVLGQLDSRSGDIVMFGLWSIKQFDIMRQINSADMGKQVGCIDVLVCWTFDPERKIMFGLWSIRWSRIL